MKVTEKDVEYVAELAHLQLTDSERVRMRQDLNAILEYIDQLAGVDTSDVEPMAQVSDLAGAATAKDVLRHDELRDCLPRQAALESAPRTDGVFFRVPKVIER
jgi:aspartyl-tRNA(Asn)/glutamyl-tRNA(Gln) amidotransferase subunit C